MGVTDFVSEERGKMPYLRTKKLLQLLYCGPLTLIYQHLQSTKLLCTRALSQPISIQSFSPACDKQENHSCHKLNFDTQRLIFRV